MSYIDLLSESIQTISIHLTYIIPIPMLPLFFQRSTNVRGARRIVGQQESLSSMWGRAFGSSTFFLTFPSPWGTTGPTLRLSTLLQEGRYRHCNTMTLCLNTTSARQSVSSGQIHLKNNRHHELPPEAVAVWQLRGCRSSEWRRSKWRHILSIASSRSLASLPPSASTPALALPNVATPPQHYR
jgi:hypothetical protein